MTHYIWITEILFSLIPIELEEAETLKPTRHASQNVEPLLIPLELEYQICQVGDSGGTLPENTDNLRCGEQRLQVPHVVEVIGV